MSKPHDGITEAVEAVRRKLLGDDLRDSDVRSIQLHMDALDQWARLGDARLAGHDHDHMDDHDHAMASPLSLIADPAVAVARESTAQ